MCVTRFALTLGLLCMTFVLSLPLARAADDPDDLLKQTIVWQVQVQALVDGDTDGDGITDVVENEAPNGGDANADNQMDSQQSRVASFRNLRDNRYVTLESPEGTRLVGVSAIDNPSPGDLPAAEGDFPVGFFTFSVEGIEAGDAVQIVLTLPPDTRPDTYFKYGRTADNRIGHWYDFSFDVDDRTGATFNGNIITRIGYRR